ncbi:hypothetical protein MMC17_003297 [Xylographa soralifera]|nr:hypothetical protein [Xylographa soralifera]
MTGMPVAMMKSPENGLSSRGWANVGEIMPKISAAVKQRSQSDNPNIDLATAENWLLRPELLDICKTAISTNLCGQDLSYPRAFAGFPEVLEAFASFFNSYFHPHLPVQIGHLATAPGAASCLDTLFYNICDPGDGILVLAPYWSGFDFQFKARSSVTPIPVAVDPIRNCLTEALLPALERAYNNASCPVKAILMTNPSNPLAQCYPQSCLEECLRFCQRKNIHYISDEVYALTSFPCAEVPEPVPFVSVLSLDTTKLGCDLSRIHTVWSTSKDLGQSGIRMGCTVTQANPEMAVGLALASNTTTSTLSSIFVSALLTSPEMPELLALNSDRLAEAYRSLTTVLRKHNVPYLPAYAGLYVFAKIAPDAESWDDESRAVEKFKEAGVLVSPGKGYHGPEGEKGWARIGFAVEKPKLEEALRRIDCALAK